MEARAGKGGTLRYRHRPQPRQRRGVRRGDQGRGQTQGHHAHGFLGRVASDGYGPWYGKVIDRNDSKNPIAYFDERAILTPGEVTADTVRLNR